MPRRALLIVNAKSRSGAAQRDIAVERLKDHGIEPVHVDCGRREDLSPLIIKHGKDVDCVVVGGGDGTLNAAADALAEAKLPLGILPLGTANDLARTLNIPVDVAAAVEVIRAGAVRTRPALANWDWAGRRLRQRSPSACLSFHARDRPRRRSRMTPWRARAGRPRPPRT